jgi:iron complex outermembrane recepter protein
VTYRFAGFVAVSAIAAALAAPASAQDAPPAAQADAPPAPDAASQADVVVTGTRVPGRSRLDTASPVDVLSATALSHQGSQELAAAMSSVAPSLDFPRPSAVDATDAIRPATLRGLSPDETLVLINGTRAHTSASVNINGSIGRGAAATDLNTIPTVALDRIEVLRDGASAQYGSDAIAGVVNVRLREARSGGDAQVEYGFYNTDIDAARSDRRTTGEPTVTASAWQGIGFGSDGYITISGEYLHRDATNRADLDPRVTPSRITGRFGDPEVTQYTGWINAGTSITDTLKLYGWVGYQDRDSRSAAFPRNENAVIASGETVDDVYGYPFGFLPLINTKSRDLNAALGIKGSLGGWDTDLSVTYGRNKIGFRTLDSANYTYGADSQTDFSDGALVYDQWVAGLDVSRQFDVFKSLNVAFGIEGRREGFQIDAGEPESYNTGTAFPTATPGAQGFVGFGPANAISAHRENGSAYVDLEAQVTDKLLVGLAGRGETYSDFGQTATGKASIRYDFTPWFALRGTFSNGFRAPSLQQEYFTSVSSVVQTIVDPTTHLPTSEVLLAGLYPSISPIATALGGKPLEPEKSTNLSFGTVIRAGGIDLTVDAYQIKIRDQIGLSENLQPSSSPATDTPTQAAIRALLAPYGVTAARFFLNGLATKTQGIDAVAHYRTHAGGAGIFDFTIAGNLNRIKVTKVPTQTGPLTDLTLFARSRIYTITEGTPGEKITGTIDWSLGDIGATARVTYYGNVDQPGTTAAADLFTGNKAITDLEIRYQPKKGAQIGLGVSNLFDIYPDKIPAALDTTGVVAFPYYSPFGYNGRYLYVRAGLSW